MTVRDLMKVLIEADMDDTICVYGGPGKEAPVVEADLWSAKVGEEFGTVRLSVKVA